MTQHSEFHILLLTDGRPGHENQSDGVVMAVERALGRKPTVTPRRLGQLKQQRFARHVLAKTGSVRLTTAIASLSKEDSATAPDMVVSTGGDTLAANALLARQYGVPNIAVGSLRGLSPELFSMVLHIDPALATTPRHWIGLKPAAVDRTLRPAQTDADRATGVVLLGGPTDAEPIAADAVERFLVEAANWRESQAIETLAIIGSRRTPDSWVAAARKIAQRDPDALRFYAASELPFSGVRAMLLGASAAFVTGDSSSMVTEAVYAGVPTVVLSSNRDPRTDTDSAYIRHLEHQNLLAVTHLQAGVTDRPTFAALLERCQPLQTDPLDTLAAAIRERRLV
ncbi:MAG: ELM1/GtrOC1 family putative glycosyltransferase [Pseudomonadota bacterium]